MTETKPTGHLLQAHVTLVDPYCRVRTAKLRRRRRLSGPWLRRSRSSRPRRAGVEQRALRADRAICGEAVVAAEERVQGGARAGYPPASCEDPQVRAAVVSDLHLGLASGRDLLRCEHVLRALTTAIADVDHLVLLGDVVELRERPVARVLPD